MIVTCPVCENDFDARDAASKIEHDEEERLFFCSDHCREQFDEEPQVYLEPSEEDVTHEAAA